MENKHVIVRADRAGVFFGILVSKTGKSVVLKECRKLYWWSGAAAVEQLAIEGVKDPDGCKFTITVPGMAVENVLQIIPCSDFAVDNIKKVKEWRR